MIEEIIIHKTVEIGGFVFLSTFFYYLITSFKILNNQNRKKGVVAGTILGLSPGCGGAISIATLFTTGVISIGALVSSMIATMGDGAFLLIAKKPKHFLILILIMGFASTAVGLLVNKFGLLSNKSEVKIQSPTKNKYHSKHIFNKFNNNAYKLFFVIMPFISIFSILHMFQGFGENVLHNKIIEILIYIVLVLMFINTIVVNRLRTCKKSCGLACFSNGKAKYVMQKTFEKTSTIVTLLFISIMIIEIMLIVFKVDLGFLKSMNPFLAIIIAALFGLIPGSAPQILVTTLFINGAIGFPILLANAIATTGDASFMLVKNYKRNLVEVLLINFITALIIATIVQLQLMT